MPAPAAAMVNAALDAARLARVACSVVLTMAVRAEFVASRGAATAVRDARAAVVCGVALVRAVRPPEDWDVATGTATDAVEFLGVMAPDVAVRVCVVAGCDDARFVPAIVVVVAARLTDAVSRTAAPA